MHVQFLTLSTHSLLFLDFKVLDKKYILHPPLKKELGTCLCCLPGLVSGWNMSLTSLETMSAFDMVAKSGSFPC